MNFVLLTGKARNQGTGPQSRDGLWEVGYLYTGEIIEGHINMAKSLDFIQSKRKAIEGLK